MQRLAMICALFVFVLLGPSQAPAHDGPASATTAATVDVIPALPHGGSSLASCVTPLMQVLGLDWSMTTTQGVLGHAFHFAMKEGGGRVMHDRMDWSEALGQIPRLAKFRRFGAKKATPAEVRAAAYESARDAVRESLGRGVPALVWQPMTVEMKKNRAHAYCWGLIVGYDDRDETYAIRHPFQHTGKQVNRPTSEPYALDTYPIRYDAMGYTDGAQWLNIRVFDGLSDRDERAIHVRALRNAVRYAKGIRYSDENFVRENGKATDPYGLRAYDVWQRAFASEDIPIEPSRYHAEVLRMRRSFAASYARSLAERLPETGTELAAAADHYDRGMTFLGPLHELLEGAKTRGSITAEERDEAADLIGKALAEDREAIGRIESALAQLAE